MVQDFSFNICILHYSFSVSVGFTPSSPITVSRVDAHFSHLYMPSQMVSTRFRGQYLSEFRDTPRPFIQVYATRQPDLAAVTKNSHEDRLIHRSSTRFMENMRYESVSYVIRSN